MAAAIADMIDELVQEIAQKQAVLTHLRNAHNAENSVSGVIPRRLRTLEMAAEVLRADGHPLHSRVIAEKIAAKYDFHAKATSIGTMLWRASQRKGSIFVKERTPDNTYGLREWQK